MEPLHEIDENQCQSAPPIQKNDRSRTVKTFSFSHRRDASRQLSTRSLPSNRLTLATDAKSNGDGGAGAGNTGGGPMSHVHNLLHSQNYHRQPSLLLLPLAAQLNPAALPITSHKQFSPNGRAISHSISNSRSTYQQQHHHHHPHQQTGPGYARTQSVAGLACNGGLSFHQDSAGSIVSNSTMPANTPPLSPTLPSPMSTTTTHPLTMAYPLQSRMSTLPNAVGHSGVESATSSSQLHAALLVSLMVLSLIGFVLTKLRDPCDDLLYVAEAESICSVTASLAFSSLLLFGSLYALLVYFLHAIGQCDYRSWNAKRQVLGEMLATGAVAVGQLMSTWAVFQFTPAVHSTINFTSAICAVLSASLLIARVILLRREHRMLHDSPLDVQRSSTLANAVAQYANPTATAAAVSIVSENALDTSAYRKFSGGYVNQAASLRSSSQSAANHSPQEEKTSNKRSSHQTLLAKSDLDELRTVDLDDEVFQV